MMITYKELLTMIFEMQNHMRNHEEVKRLECHVIQLPKNPCFEFHIVYSDTYRPSSSPQADQKHPLFDVFRLLKENYPDIYEAATVDYPPLSENGRFVFRMKWISQPPKWHHRIIAWFKNLRHDKAPDDSK